jgi:hypothetical protein
MCVCVFVHNNRCIDYSKASHGISLVPRPETFAFKEAFDLPLNCIRDNHTHATITLKIQSVSICPFIISDRQWIQENILCLVSNSVKYSGQPSCEVLITVRLSSMDGLPSSPWIDRQVGCCVCVCVCVRVCVHDNLILIILFVMKQTSGGNSGSSSRVLHSNSSYGDVLVGAGAGKTPLMGSTVVDKQTHNSNLISINSSSSTSAGGGNGAAGTNSNVANSGLNSSRYVCVCIYVRVCSVNSWVCMCLCVCVCADRRVEKCSPTWWLKWKMPVSVCPIPRWRSCSSHFNRHSG